LNLPLARVLGEVCVRGNSIAPGLIDTPIYGEGDFSEQFKDKLKKDVLFPKRLGFSSEFASLAVELLSNSYMNGETIRIDGGARLQPK
jgi:NAD(P)-dependent dehydrogenase (short-subunit alcohol dehydrogenase family)